MDEPNEPIGEGPAGIDPAIARTVGIVAVVLVAGAAVLFGMLRKPPPPPPPDVAKDPLLSAGREVFLGRCVSCHGETGQGNGPIAKGLAGPPVGDFTRPKWKHGEDPEQVLGVIRQGVKDTSMAPWGKVLSPEEVQGAAAYVYYLGRREVPASLRRP